MQTNIAKITEVTNPKVTIKSEKRNGREICFLNLNFDTISWVDGEKIPIYCNIPKISLNSFSFNVNESTVTFKVIPCSNGELMNCNLNKETPKEMTLEDIEKQLGHKIKLVSKSC